MARSYNSVNVVYGRAFIDTVAAAYKTDPGAALVVAPKVRLSTDPGFNPVPGMLIADFTGSEAAFTGYTAGGYTLTMSAPVNAGALIQGVSGNVVPVAGSPFVSGSEQVYGYWIDDGANVICGERFANGLIFGFAAAGDYLDLGIVLPLMLMQAAQ